MSTYIIHKGKSKHVTNLSWLLRHSKEVKWIGFNYTPDINGRDGELVARMSNGAAFFADWFNFQVAWNWLNRPKFQGLQFRLVNQDGFQRIWTIGSCEWKKIENLDYNNFIKATVAECDQPLDYTTLK